MFNPREHHYSVQDLAAIWNVSTCLVRDLFAEEPGVIKISRRTSPHPRPSRGNANRKPRGWCQLRIPESIAQRVYERLTQAPPKIPPRRQLPPSSKWANGGAL